MEKERRLMDAISARNARRLATRTQATAEHASMHAEAHSDWPCKLKHSDKKERASMRVLVWTRYWCSAGTSWRLP
jgi:hypothetical protein